MACRWVVDQLTRKFMPPQLDRLGIKPGDAGELGDTGAVRVVGEGADIPAALGFGHATQQQVDLVVAPGQGCVRPRCTGAAGALMNLWARCGHCRVALLVRRQSIITLEVILF